MDCVEMNPYNTEGILVGSNLALRTGYTVMIDEAALTLKGQLHSLEVLLDPALLLDKQLEQGKEYSW